MHPKWKAGWWINPVIEDKAGQPKPLIEVGVSPATVVGKRKTRLPITRVFTSALVIILALFIIISALSFIRLQDFRFILSDIVEKSVPNMAISHQIYSQVNSLTFMSERLANASSDATRRLASRQITDQLSQLRALAQEQNSDPHLLVQLQALSLEFSELNELIELRLKSEKALNQQQLALYQLYDQAIQLAGKTTESESSTQYSWTLYVSDLVALAGQANNMKRLHLIRQLAEQISVKLALLDTQIVRLKIADRDTARAISTSLRNILIGENGLIALQVERLQITGRATGRGNFVRNLIIDYAGLAEYQSFQINSSVINESQSTNEQVQKQVQLIGIASIVAITVIFAVTFFLHSRVVNRLNKLNQRVQYRLDGRDSPIYVGGNDEISDIGKTFDLFAKTVEEQNKILHDLSLSDGLTGIANRRALDERLLHEVKQSKRHKWPVSVLLIDVDFFKLYNDNYGHDQGDECLRHVAMTLNEQMQRNGDFLARYGGEEFVCILPDTGTEGAEYVGQILLERIQDKNIVHEYSSVAPHVTVSIGIATLYPDSSDMSGPQVLLKLADNALYEAKKQGRNRLVSHSKDSGEQ